MQSTQKAAPQTVPPRTAVGRRRSAPADLLTVLAVATIGALLYLPMLGSFGPLDPTDSFFIESGREMLETGNYIVALDNYQPWLDKPILAFWMIAGMLKLLGVSALAGRLHSAISAILLGVVVYAGSRPFAGRPASLMAALIFLSCPLACVIGHLSLTDMPLALFTTASILFLARGAWQRSTGYLACGYAALGLAVMCKGPIAVVLVALTFLISIAASARGLEDSLRAAGSFRPALGAIIVLAFNLPWYAAATVHTHGAFFYDFFIRQNFGRMVGHVNHQQHWWFYIPVFFGGLFPWSLYLFSAPGLPAHLWRRRHTGSERDRLLLLSASWALAVLGLFGAIKTKLPTYILPALPAVAILVGMQLDMVARSAKFRRLLLISVPVFSGAVAVFVLKTRLHGYLRAVLTDNALLILAIAGILGAHCLLLLGTRQTPSVVALLAGALLACGTFVPLGLSAFHKEKQAGFDQLVLRSKASNVHVAILMAEQPSMAYVLHRPVPRLMTREDVQDYLRSPGKPHWLVVPRGVLNKLEWCGALPRLLETSGKWSLFSLD